MKKDKEIVIRIINIRMLLLRFSYFTFDPNNLEIVGRVHRLFWVINVASKGYRGRTDKKQAVLPSNSMQLSRQEVAGPANRHAPTCA